MEALILLLLLDALLACAFYKRLKGRAYVIPALIGLGVAGFQAYQGYKQKKQAKKLKASNYVPPSVEEALVSARMHSTADSPGHRRGLERLKQSSASSISASKRIGGSSAQLQQGVADTDAREKEHSKDLQVANSAFKNQARNNVQDLLLTKGGYEQQSQDSFNAAKSALIGASQQNTYNAVTTLGEGLVHSLPDSSFGGTGVQKPNTGAQNPPPLTPKQKYAQTFKMRGNSRGLGRFNRGPGEYNPYDPSMLYDPRYSRYNLKQYNEYQ